MLSPVIAPAWPCSVGDDRARRGANETARNRGTGPPAGQTADERAATAADQCATENPVLPGAARATGERQRHRNHHQCAHLLLLADRRSLTRQTARTLHK